MRLDRDLGRDLRRPARRRFVTDFELRYVPELGCSNADRPWPRSELAINTSSIIRGYYKDAKPTAGIRDENCRILTGDVFELRGLLHAGPAEAAHTLCRGSPS